MSIDNASKNTFDNTKVARCYSYSEKHSIIYMWEINEITSFLEVSKHTEEQCTAIKSSSFTTGSKFQDSWYLDMTIDQVGESSKKKSWVSLYLFPNHENQKIRAKYSIYLLNNKREKIKNNFMACDEMSNDWTEYLFENSNYGYGYNKFVKIDELLKKGAEFIQNDTLTVCVHLIVYDKYVADDITVKSLQSSKRRLGDDITDLLIKSKCDVLISVGKEKFDAHKLILSARSCVFEAMFTHDMMEKKENKITIPDIDPKVFKKVLEFIYTDKVDDLNCDAEELLEAADKYQLQPLKELCEDHLSDSLTVENATRILILADRHHANRLKEFVINYIVANFAKFRSHEEFKTLEKSHPFLFLAVLKKYSAIDFK